MHRALACLTLAGLMVLAPATLAQPIDINVAQLSRISPHNAYNDIWGYTAPDGREYAAIGTTTGFSILNVTDPVEPYEVAYFPGGLCTWRDLKTYDHYLYVVTDCQGGVEVVDLSDPENPVHVNTFALGTVNHSHNVQIDVDTGILYLVGTQAGMYVYDLTVDPVDPPLRDVWGPSRYIHDVSVQDGMAHAALIYDGDYRILDVTNPNNVTTINTMPSGAEFTHSTWPSEDNSLVVAADETAANRHLAFYDTSNPNNPQLVGKYTENKFSIPHNPFLEDGICHVSWYTEGYIALDLSDPANPTKIGRFDTQPDVEAGGQNGFKGAWGVYPFADNGFVYVSDRSRGLFVLSLNDCSIGLPNQPAPQICRVWPDTVPAMASPRQRVVLTGRGFTNATAVTIGGTVVGPDDFKVVTDQLIHLRLPLVSQPGFNDITVTRAGGTSLPAQIEVTPSSEILLDTGDVEQPVNSTMLVAIGAEPGDLLFPALSFTESPSVVPNKVAFDIGAGFSDLTLLPSFPANAAGVGGFPVVIPAVGLGATVYWQVAVVDPQQGLPAAVTQVRTTTIVEAEGD